MREINQGFNQAVLRQLEKMSDNLTKGSVDQTDLNIQSSQPSTEIPLTLCKTWVKPLSLLLTGAIISQDFRFLLFCIWSTIVSYREESPVSSGYSVTDILQPPEQSQLLYSNAYSQGTSDELYRSQVSSCLPVFGRLQALFRPASQWSDHMQHQHIILWGLAPAPTCHRFVSSLTSK